MKAKIDDFYLEWDENKDRVNKKKHGISFETAKYVFADVNRVEFYNENHSTLEEDRYFTLGMVEDILFVVYTERGKNVRLISARIANERERRIYSGDY